MGLDVEKEYFTDEEFERFSQRLHDSVRAMEALLARPGFGVGPSTVGAELEMFLIDHEGKPTPVADQILDDTKDPRVTHEIGLFNIEMNLTATGLEGDPFATFTKEIDELQSLVGASARSMGSSIASIGILPTLTRVELFDGLMSLAKRYKALERELKKPRDMPFRVSISGEEELDVDSNTITLESANTAFQLHLRCSPDEFAARHNAAQLITAPVVAAAGNSPFFLGKNLWAETRIPLFTQAVDDRPDTPRTHSDGDRPRVTFGADWIGGVLDLYKNYATNFRPLLPLMDEEEPLDAIKEGRVPKFSELRLHTGTIWQWNRPVFDPNGEGHLRIEFRSMPSGPTSIDMMANSAFLLGTLFSLEPNVEELISGFSFENARRNFQAGARYGLDAHFDWPRELCGMEDKIPAPRVIESLLHPAKAALIGKGVDPLVAEKLLTIILNRATSGRTGANWQRKRVLLHLASTNREEALGRMFADYRELSEKGDPVHTWPD